MKDSHRRTFIALVVAAAGGALAGCSGTGDNLPREAVGGSVTLDGAPLAGGTIQFNPVDASTGVAGGATIKGGKFAIPRETGLVPGSYRVSIFSGGAAGQGKPQSPEGVRRKATIKTDEAIPEKYNAKTELKADIKKGGGNENMSFALTTK